MYRVSVLIASTFVFALGAKAENDTWISVGSNENRIAAAWAQVSSLERLNNDSFSIAYRFNYKDNLISSKLELNCRNKDYSIVYPAGFFEKRTGWSSVPAGSSVGVVANIFCRSTNAKELWGYTAETSFLWNQPVPKSMPGNAKGDWVAVTNDDESESYYNDAIERGEKFIRVASWFRAKKGDRPAANPMDDSKFYWINVSCESNLYSQFFELDSPNSGVWLAPVPGRPGRLANVVKKAYCP